jgi:nucleoside-diphosphate kinase
MSNLTLSIIKPEAVEDAFTGKILDLIENKGFEIIALKKVQASQDQMKTFYEVHAQRPFYMELVDYMASSPIIVMVLKKEKAVSSFRDLIGATDPAEASTGTIRNLYGQSKAKNSIHGSDSDENATKEIDFWFDSKEIIS